MLVYYFLAAIVIWLGILSLRSGFRFSRYIKSEIAKPLAAFTPFVSVIAPSRGLDQGLLENTSALFAQQYPNYEVIFVTDHADDASLRVLQSVVEQHGIARIPTRTVIAGPAIDSGQKVHNLRVAAAQTDPRSEVFVFVDMDARPGANWLRDLVAPLVDESIGAGSGYRWFLPVRGGFATHLRSVWNASIASALGDARDKNFCWGGSTAIRRLTFERLNISERWRGTVSDDFTLTRVLQEANLPIHFVPSCLVPSFEDCSFRELMEFTNRQLKITRVYAPHLWKPLLIGSLLFTLVFLGGAALVIARAAMGLSFITPLLLLVVIFILGAAKAYVRFKAVALVLTKHREVLQRTLAAHLLLWPFASVLFLWNAIVAGFSRRIEWRGITYELKSPTEAVIIRR